MNPAAIQTPRFGRARAIFFALIAAAAVLLVGIDAPGAIVAVRFLLLAALGLAAWLLRRQDPFLLLVPPFLLSLLSLFFYSLIPSMAAALSENLAPSFIFWTIPDGGTHIGKTAERFILFFSMVSLALAVAVGPHLRLARPTLPGSRWVLGAGALWVFLIGAWIAGLNFLSSGLWIDKQILDAFPPLIAALAALLFFHALSRGHAYAAGVFLFTLASFTFIFIFVGALKTGGFLASAMTVLLIGAARSVRRTAAVLGLCLVLFSLVIGHFGMIRNFSGLSNPGFWYRNFETFIGGQLVDKISTRQMETGSCLEKTLRRADAGESREASPLYFLGALVPRFLWKDKPSLSDVSLAIRDICFKDTDLTQSFSFTLIGEPLLVAGKMGLTVAAIFFFVAHGLILVAAARAGPAGTVALLALAPWLMDFDQYFALYWANAVKMFLYMLPVLVVVAVLAKRVSGETPTSSEPRGIGPR